MRRLTKLLLVILSSLLILACGVVPAFAEGEPGFTLSSPDPVDAGRTFTIDLSVVNNPGIISARVRITYNTDVLEYVRVEDKGVLKGFSPLDAVSSPFVLRWSDPLTAANNTANGLAAVITFKVKDTAAAGTTAVTVTPLETRNMNGDRFTFLSAVSIITLNGGTQGGVSVTGEVQSYNPTSATTVQLVKGTEISYETTIAAVPMSTLLTTDPQALKQPRTKTFTFTGVAPGTYSLVITKQAHTAYTVQSIVVGASNLGLTLDPRPGVKLITLLCGDIDGGGSINQTDLSELWKSFNYDMPTGSARNALCDLNGDGYVGEEDLAILRLPNHYGKGSVTVQ